MMMMVAKNRQFDHLRECFCHKLPACPPHSNNFAWIVVARCQPSLWGHLLKLETICPHLRQTSMKLESDVCKAGVSFSNGPFSGFGFSGLRFWFSLAGETRPSGILKGPSRKQSHCSKPKQIKVFFRGGGFDMVIWRCYHCVDEIGRSWKMIWSLTRLLAVWFVVSVGCNVLCIFVAPSGVHIWRLGC